MLPPLLQKMQKKSVFLYGRNRFFKILKTDVFLSDLEKKKRKRHRFLTDVKTREKTSVLVKTDLKTREKTSVLRKTDFKTQEKRHRF